MIGLPFGAKANRANSASTRCKDGWSTLEPLMVSSRLRLVFEDSDHAER